MPSKSKTMNYIFSILKQPTCRRWSMSATIRGHSHWPAITTVFALSFTKIFKVVGKRKHKILFQHIVPGIFNIVCRYGSGNALVLFKQIKYGEF